MKYKIPKATDIRVVTVVPGCEASVAELTTGDELLFEEDALITTDELELMGFLENEMELMSAVIQQGLVFSVPFANSYVVAKIGDVKMV